MRRTERFYSIYQLGGDRSDEQVWRRVGETLSSSPLSALIFFLESRGFVLDARRCRIWYFRRVWWWRKYRLGDYMVCNYDTNIVLRCKYPLVDFRQK